MGLFGKNKETVINGAVKLVGNIRGMIDDSTLTKEEAAKYNIKIADAAAKFATDTMNENTIRSITRRLLAVISVIYFYVLTLGLIIMGKYDNEWYLATKELIIEFRLPEAFIVIIAFFFGAHLIRSYQGGKK